MSNFSNIGFRVTTQEELQHLLEKVYRTSTPIKIDEGAYYVFTDSSGAELYIQFNTKQEFLGVNPHFKGKSKRTVSLTNSVLRPESELDGAFHCWSSQPEDNNPDSSAFPFVFDVPDFKSIGQIDFPKKFEIQLTAFAQELSIYDSEKHYDENQTAEPKWATHSFAQSGLFSFEEGGSDPNPPQATGIFTGIIKQLAKKKNELTNEEFYWFLVDTLGGEIDVVADPRYFEKEPFVNGVLQGLFWLSGRLINAPKRDLTVRKTFFQKLFGR